MKKVSLFVLMMMVPVVANAAGTYYSGYTSAYQSPQTSYSSRQTGYANRYNTTYSAPSYASRYNTAAATQNRAVAAPAQQTASTTSSTKKSGFWLDAGISHEVGQWRFDMAQSGSVLSYDNLAWNVFDVSAGYAFNVGNTALQVDAGLKYGMQWGESPMYDDDITSGGFLVTTWIEAGTETVIGDQIGHALSMGTSQGGNMLGFNIGFGMPDVFKVGNVTFTPSIGYRYFKHKLETENNYGLSVDTTACFQIEGSDEIQCDPAIIVNWYDEEEQKQQQQIIWRDDIDLPMDVPGNAESINTGSTYYYHQPGVSHSYETTWAGPYIAMDMDYVINQNNAVNGRLELGFPGYTSVGDQPYRFDWAHPKSVEDEAGMFSAFHLGMAANWTTAITDSVALSLGVTYDYYTVSGANAKTYLNGSFYTDWYNEILNSTQWNGDEEAMLNPDTGDATAINIKALEESCPGWVCSTDGEIESFYKSLGIRVGINAKF